MLSHTKLLKQKMEEIWKDIKDYEGKYQCSNYGRVRSLDRITLKDGLPYQKIKGKMLKANKIKNGYFVVNLRYDDKRKAFTFIGLLLKHLFLLKIKK